MLVQRIELSDTEGNRVRIEPYNGHFVLQVNCVGINGGSGQTIYMTVPMLRQLARMLKFLEVGDAKGA